MKRYLPVLLLLLTAFTKLRSQQTIFLSEGKIEFTRTINLYARMVEGENSDSWNELQKKTMPKFKTSFFDLYFSNNQWVYKPGRANPDNNRLWPQPAEDNVVFGDYESGKGAAQKTIEGETFLIQDSLRHIKWKLTDENRVIAGFNCRRANAIIMDSIYVVAFYTDEITTPGGPESFSGLPGMILGVSLPHNHISWFASKVETVPVAKNILVAPVKGKKSDYKTFAGKLSSNVKDWGKYGRPLLEMSEF